MLTIFGRATSVAVIPGGCTSKIQPLDVCLNKPLKCYCLNQWMEYMQKQVATPEPGERPKTAKQQVIDWVVDSNKLLKSKGEMFIKSFLVCSVSNALDGSQNSIICCTKELPDMMITYGLE